MMRPTALLTAWLLPVVAGAALPSTGAQTTVSARVRAARDVKVAARVAGVVVARPVARNTAVKAGQAILVIDSRFQELAVRRARAAVDKAVADLAWAESELAREEKLQKGSSTSESQLHRLRTARDAAAAQLALQRIVVEEAEETLARCTVRAPEDGVLAEIWPEVGEAVPLLSPVARVVTAHELVVESFLAPEEVVRVKAGSTLTVHVDLPTPATLQGKVTELATVAADRTYRIRLALASPPAGLLPGFPARIVLPELPR